MSSSDLDFCRLCFREDGNISVFDYKCDDAWSLTDRIFECVSVQISPNDKLPHVICEFCLDHVIKWCEFKTVCDRNQRAWFLWLKSLSFATPQEIREGLAENARKKSLELGHGCQEILSKKSAFQQYDKPSLQKDKPLQNPSCQADNSDDDCVIIVGEEAENDRANNVKKLKIESTQSLVGVFPNKETQFESHNQKLTNGFLILDASGSGGIPSKDVEGSSSSNLKEQPSAAASSNESNKGCSLPIEVPAVKELGINKNVGDSDINDSLKVCNAELGHDAPPEHSMTSENYAIDDDVDDDNDVEIENAFSTEPSDDPITDREMALLNGIDPSDNEPNLPNNTLFQPSGGTHGSSDKELPSNFTVPSVPKRFGSPNPQEILKIRLLQGKASETGLSEQPKRPDTPYPHEILKNMAPILETSSHIKIIPAPKTSPLAKPFEGDQNMQTTHAAITLKPAGSSQELINIPAPCVSRMTSSQVATHELSQTPCSTPIIKPASFTHLMGDIPVPSGRLSESSDSSSYQQLDVSVRVKQEPLSEDDYSDDNDSSFSNISIKMEPMEYTPEEQEQEATTPDLPPTDCSYCDVCNKQFSCHVHLVRHILQSAIHKRVSSFKALGHKVDSRVISQLSKEVRSQALFRSYARRQMKAMETKSSLRESNNDLLECKTCNVILKSRSHKIKHDNSFAHKSNLGLVTSTGDVEGVNEGLILSPLDRQLRSTPPTFPQAGPSHLLQPPSAVASEIPQTTYKCPFASCSVIFNDGGQLIVHMHTHGISLPMHEVNKQIELSQKQQKKPTSKKYVPVDGKFPCRRCNRVFIKALSLSNHLRRCRGLPAPKPMTMMGLTVQCPICNIVQKNSRTLTYHMKMYHPNVQQTIGSASSHPVVGTNTEFQSNSDDAVCPVCNKHFPSRLHLRSHSYKVHQMKPVACKICKRLFQSKDKLHVHYRKDHLKIKDGDFVCYSCFQTFPNKSECWRHKKLGCSLKMRLFTCSECNHSFKSEALLEEHRQEHFTLLEPKIEIIIPPLDLSFLDDVRNTNCKICGRSYTSYHNLKRHVNACHTESDNGSLISTKNIISEAPEPVALGMNDYNFTPGTIGLNIPPRRTRNNNCERNFPCLYCEGRFSTNSNRLTHMKSVCRAAPPKVVCQNCKMERGAWVTGLCKHCGKDVNTRKRSAPVSIEPDLKNPKLNESQIESSFQQPDIDQPSIKVNKYQYTSNFIYKCTVGKRTFVSQKTMLSHSTSCDGQCKDQKVYCKVCHLLFPSPKIYIKHKPCNGRKQQQKLFPSGKRKRNIHKTVPCQFCEFKFSSRKTCLVHMRKQHNYYISSERRKLFKAAYFESDMAKDDTGLSNASSGLEEQQFEELKVEEEAGSASQSVIDNLDPNENTCRSCLKCFASHTSLLQHIKYIHKNKFATVECAFCSKDILKRQLYEHGFSCIKDQLANINTLECVVCSTVFYSSDEEDTLSLKLQEHIMNCCGRLSMAKGEKFKNKEKFLCLKCCMIFSSKKSLYAHSYKRHGILIQTSPNLPQKNITNEENEAIPNINLSEIVNEETGSVNFAEKVDNAVLIASTPIPSLPAPNRFSCNRCSKQFKTGKGLKCHKATAHLYQARKKKKGLPSLKCQFCQRHFFNEHKLRNHEKVHGIVQEIVLTEAIEKVSATPSAPLSIKKEVDVITKQQDMDNIIDTVSAPES